ncbi:glycosyl transferase family 2 [Lactiplantibacillus plantarum EGD-AQ4]|nr:glycosyl transferase family 2 [Lactiplantibacillus plantarum EGD-AQ4]
MKFASVIVTYNRKRLLGLAINALLNQTQKPSKIIVVDNNSTDGTEDFLSQLGLLNNDLVRYVKLPENIGGSGGFNVGVKVALEYNVDWISLSDDDAIFSTDYFKCIDIAATRQPEVKAFSGTIKLPDGRIQLDQRNKVVNWNHFKAIPIPKSEYDHDFNIDVFTFCGCVINTELIRKIGLPQRDYFIWYDDIEYSLRIRRLSEIVNVSSATLIHHTNWGGTASSYKPDWREYYGIRNRIVTIKNLGENKLDVALWIALFLPLTLFRVLSKSFYKGYRKHVLYVNFTAFQDAMNGTMGKSLKFVPR